VAPSKTLDRTLRIISPEVILDNIMFFVI